DKHQNARALLFDGDTLLDHLLRQARLSRRDPVLRQHVCRVLVDTDFKVDIELHAAVAGVRRLHVDHLIDAVHFLLDGRRYRLFHRHRGSARVGRRDSDGRRRQEWVLLDGETLEAEQSHQNHQDRNDDGDDKPADEKVYHGLFSPRLDLALGRQHVWSKGSFFQLYSLGADLNAGLHFLKPFHDDLFARLQSRFDDPEIADAFAGFDHALLHRRIRLYDHDAIESLNLLHCELGHEQGILLEIGYEPGFPILAWA